MSLRIRRLESLFPPAPGGGLVPGQYESHSRWSKVYNCIAFANGDCQHVWDDNTWWPVGSERGGETQFLVDALATIGFMVCADGRLERGFEKIVIYAVGEQWTHAAHLRPDGWWESKIGELEDIIHRTPSALEGTEYGDAKVFMRRELRLRMRAMLDYRSKEPNTISCM